MNKKSKSTNNEERIHRIQSFLTDGTYDYVGARTLFLSYLPQQAAILSSTAIEKSFKAILAFNGNESHGHLKKAHWNAVKNFDKELFELLNKDFLELNKKVYSMRYSDNLASGFNVVIACREFLAELDYTFLTIVSRFQFRDSQEPYKFTKLESFIRDKDDRLFLENHILAGINKDEYIYSSAQLIYEFRIMPNNNPIEMLYWSEKAPKLEGFLRTGIKLKEEKCKLPHKISIDMAFYPIPGKPVTHNPEVA